MVVTAVPEMVVRSHGCSVSGLAEARATEGRSELVPMPGGSLVTVGVEEPAAH